MVEAVESRLDLGAHLQRVAPINEDRSLIGQDNGHARRTAEPGHPRQPFGARG